MTVYVAVVDVGVGAGADADADVDVVWLGRRQLELQPFESGDNQQLQLLDEMEQPMPFSVTAHPTAYTKNLDDAAFYFHLIVVHKISQNLCFLFSLNC